MPEQAPWRFQKIIRPMVEMPQGHHLLLGRVLTCRDDELRELTHRKLREIDAAVLGIAGLGLLLLEELREDGRFRLLQALGLARVRGLTELREDEARDLVLLGLGAGVITRQLLGQTLRGERVLETVDDRLDRRVVPVARALLVALQRDRAERGDDALVVERTDRHELANGGVGLGFDLRAVRGAERRVLRRLVALAGGVALGAGARDREVERAGVLEVVARGVPLTAVDGVGSVVTARRARLGGDAIARALRLDHVRVEAFVVVATGLATEDLDPVVVGDAALLGVLRIEVEKIVRDAADDREKDQVRRACAAGEIAELLTGTRELGGE